MQRIVHESRTHSDGKNSMSSGLSPNSDYLPWPEKTSMEIDT